MRDRYRDGSGYRQPERQAQWFSATGAQRGRHRGFHAQRHRRADRGCRAARGTGIGESGSDAEDRRAAPARGTRARGCDARRIAELAAERGAQRPASRRYPGARLAAGRRGAYRCRGSRRRHRPGAAAAPVRRLLHHPRGRQRPRSGDRAACRRRASRADFRDESRRRRRALRDRLAIETTGASPLVESVEEKLPRLNGLKILVVDDDAAIVRSLKRVLAGLGAEVRGVGGVREARLSLSDGCPDAMLTDLQLKDGSGLDLLPDYLSECPHGAFYMITGHGSVDNAVRALRQGARHYFEKPVDPLALARRLESDLAGAREHGDLAETLAPYLIFRDAAMAEALRDVPRFARSREAVMIQGETGTGKELVAHALHGLSPRVNGPFVAVNCGAIPDSMLEAELFGYEKGAFTGATRQHRGRFEQADGGTL
ncbi:MAG TPA: sigma-54-dependent Fis family transcriptional regulator, partial [Chromatiaceae bacterium]|nr:sigma-54-dependent Fis family transcriptional regulator [Chromatiaceae bacterium]